MNLIKPNADELANLVGRNLYTIGDALEAGRELNGLGVEVALVSLGADGALAITADEAVWVLRSRRASSTRRARATRPWRASSRTPSAKEAAARRRPAAARPRARARHRRLLGRPRGVAADHPHHEPRGCADPGRAGPGSGARAARGHAPADLTAIQPSIHRAVPEKSGDMPDGGSLIHNWVLRVCCSRRPFVRWHRPRCHWIRPAKNGSGRQRGR